MTVTQSQDTSLGTLSARTSILNVGPVMTRGGKLLSVRGAHAVHQMTAGDGPFIIGVMWKGLSTTLLEEFLEIVGPVTPSAVVPSERSNRGEDIRTLGVLTPRGDGTVCVFHMDNQSLKGLRFTEEEAGWSWWLYNIGQQLTTGAIWTAATQCFVKFNPSG